MKDYKFWLQDEINEECLKESVILKKGGIQYSDKWTEDFKWQGSIRISRKFVYYFFRSENDANKGMKLIFGKSPNISIRFREYLNEGTDYEKLAETCKQRMSESDDYKEYFQKKLKEYKVESPDELSDEDKKKFYDDVDAGWEGDEEMNESVSWKEIYSAMKGVKTSVGVPLQEMIKDYQNALIKVASIPSSIKPYLVEAGFEFPEADKVNKAIDAVSAIKLVKEKL